MFKYKITDSEVTITGLDSSDYTHIDIPEFIDGYPVKRIDIKPYRSLFIYTLSELISFNFHQSVDYINPELFVRSNKLRLINNDVVKYGLIMNNKFILTASTIGFIVIKRIIYSICDDYYYFYGDNEYFIDGLGCNENFNRYNKKII